MSTKIEWADETWNPVSGCTKVSDGCKFCYAERLSKRFGWDFSRVTLHPNRLEIPLRWRKPRTVFVCSMGDLFHEDVPETFIWRVLQTMAAAQNHTFQVLTKRPKRMREIMLKACPNARNPRPLPNVWLGVSVENQKAADERIPLLLDTPAAVRFVSCEPLLSGLDLGPWLPPSRSRLLAEFMDRTQYRLCISWVIVGGESGQKGRWLVKPCECKVIGIKQSHSANTGDYFPGPSRPDDYRPPNCMLCGGTGWRPKPEALEWVRDIQRQCQAAGVPFFFKGWAGPRPTSGGRLLDGREWNEYPSGCGIINTGGLNNHTPEGINAIQRPGEGP